MRTGKPVIQKPPTLAMPKTKGKEKQSSVLQVAKAGNLNPSAMEGYVGRKVYGKGRFPKMSK